MRIFISLSGKEQIVKGSRIAVRQGKDYWVATVTRRSSDGTVSLQYDEGTKDSGVSLRSVTHLPDNTKSLKKPLTKEQIQAIVEKAKSTAKKVVPAAKVVPAKKVSTTQTVKVLPVEKTTTAKKVETLDDLRGQLQQLDRDELADRKRGRITDEQKAQLATTRAAIMEKIKKLMPERQYEDNELADSHAPTANRVMTRGQDSNKKFDVEFSPKMLTKTDLGDLSRADPRDIKSSISKVLDVMHFTSARDLVSAKSKFALHPLSMAVPVDFEMGPDNMKKQKGTAIETIMAVAEKAGLKADHTDTGFRLTSKLGHVDFIVDHKAFAKGNRGLLVVTPI